MKRINKNPYIVINTYDQLTKELKSLDIGPQEAFNLAYRNKYQFNARYYWTMNRISMYLRVRIIKYIKENIKISKNNPKSSTFKDFQKETLANMPSKIASCRETVNLKLFKNEFKKFNPKVKFDPRKEAQTLHKLVTDKRKNKRYFSKPNSTYFNPEGKKTNIKTHISQYQINLVR